MYGGLIDSYSDSASSHVSRNMYIHSLPLCINRQYNYLQLSQLKYFFENNIKNPNRMPSWGEGEYRPHNAAKPPGTKA